MRGAPEAPPAAPAVTGNAAPARIETPVPPPGPAQADERLTPTTSVPTPKASAARTESRAPAERPAAPRTSGQRESLTPEQLRMRHFCMNEGHGSPECRRFFQRMQSLRKEGRL
jgi:hypothetical protein